LVAYIRTIVERLADQLFDDSIGPHLDEIVGRMRELREELERLSPIAFRPDRRFDFVEVRRRVRELAAWSRPDWVHHLGIRSGEYVREKTNFVLSILAVLDAYTGESTGAALRSFAFVSSPDLREIIERDYRELSLTLMPERAWKSAVVMAGGILEAILYDQLTRNATRASQAMAHPEAPKKKGGVVKDINNDTAEDEWRLADLIEVAAGLVIIPPHRAASIDQVLRDYRNFVHPRKEIKRQHPCREAEAYQAKGSLDGVCDHLDPTIT
jgi:hypothetical protein